MFRGAELTTLRIMFIVKGCRADGCERAQKTAQCSLFRGAERTDVSVHRKLPNVHCSGVSS